MVAIFFLDSDYFKMTAGYVFFLIVKFVIEITTVNVTLAFTEGFPFIPYL